MYIVFRSAQPNEAYRIRDVLRAAGIDADVTNEILAGVRGEVPMDMSTMPSVWIADEARAEEARAIVADARQPATGDDWTCPACGEILEAAFTACWRCEADRP